MNYPRILVVDDFEPVRRMMLLALAEAGAEVIGAATVREAVSQPGPFDLLVLDRRLPNGSGPHVADHFSGVPTLYVSGIDGTPPTELHKPFTARELVTAVHKKLAAWITR